jgi:2-polyprenyl-3-methyl-5-hydroxy-6-metoxy-1,4-benzoquinol methylase
VATDPAERLAERIFKDALGALELYALYLGERLGLYRALAEGGAATPAELASRTHTSQRLVREWLEQQTSSGLLEVADAGAEPAARRYSLPADLIPVLADADATGYLARMGVNIVRAGRRLPDVVESFRTGTAPPPLPWQPEGWAEFNRPRYLNLLGRLWLPAVGDVDQRLRREPPARVADIACGSGWSSIAMALAYPSITVDGFDLDADVIDLARRNAADRGVEDRVKFEVRDAVDMAGEYDLVTIFEALHDMTRPVEVLRAVLGMLGDGGTVIVADELVEEAFRPNAPDRDRYAYAWSVVSCLPGAMGDPETAATGAVMRPSTLRGYCLEAGFSRMEVLPIETPFWRFYRIWP